MTIQEPAREINVRESVDVLVVGGGPAGIMAAYSAAKDKNLKVMLLESRGFLGGNLTIGLPILAYLGPKGNQVIQGEGGKFLARLQERGAATANKRCKLHQSFTIVDGEEVKALADEMMEEAGVQVLMYAFCCGALVKDGKVEGVVIESKCGREAILAKTVIDCSGDGDVAFRAGVECHKGDADGGLQPPTLMYSLKGVDVQALRDAIVGHPDIYDMDTMPPEQFKEGKFITVGLRNQILKAREAGLDVPVSRTILITGLEDDEIWVNMTRVSGTDSTEPASYTRGEITARKQMKVVSEYLRKYVPGFANAWLDKVAPFMGIRESRVIVGKYVMTAEDMVSMRRFDDVITVAGYPVDIHHSKGGDCTMVFTEDAYDIPYRVLVPEKIEGLLVAGRCSSMNHEAMAGTRVMSTCMGLGEAAGTAARIALEDGVLPSEVNVRKVQKALLENGAYLGDLKI